MSEPHWNEVVRDGKANAPTKMDGSALLYSFVRNTLLVFQPGSDEAGGTVVATQPGAQDGWYAADAVVELKEETPEDDDDDDGDGECRGCACRWNGGKGCSSDMTPKVYAAGGAKTYPIGAGSDVFGFLVLFLLPVVLFRTLWRKVRAN